jgi:hypothetical protein
MSWFSIVSTLIVLALAYGIVNFRNRKIHVPVMLGCFVADVVLVLAIELNRAAVETAVDQAVHPTNPLLVFHIVVSLMTVVLYGVLTYLGFGLLKGQTQYLKWHKHLAHLFIVLRLTNYVTSFMVGGAGEERLHPTVTAMGL